MKKKCLKFVEVLTEFDLFAPNINVRYQIDNDYKTLTGAILSFALIVFFAVIFFNRFTTMLNRTQITASLLLQEELDPSFYNTSTPNFLFAIGVTLTITQLTSVDMNTGNRYFTVTATSTKVVNGAKTKVTLLMGKCDFDEWNSLGDHFGYLYNKLQFQKWLCPKAGQIIELQGKYSSDVFKYLKISLNTCTGTVNGQGCKTAAQVASFLAANEVFGFNFYYINTLINSEEQEPTTIFLDDTNNFPFSTTTGTSCNFFIQSFTINTDNSLLPFDDITTVSGGLSDAPALMTSYQATQGQYLRFYVRKSPAAQIYTRTFFKFDDLLSYIGGLFGLIAMVIQLPLTYYNTCCFELSLSTDLFVYKQNKKSLENGNGTSSANGRDPNLQTQQIQPLDSNKKLEKEQNEELLHSVDKFNFLVYLGYVPFFILKKFGWKSLQSKKFTPYYEAIKQARRQIDIGVLIQRVIYFERVEKSLLDEDQRKLMHIYPKENIYQLKAHRSGVKLRDKLKEAIIKKETEQILNAILPDIIPQPGQDMPEGIQELRQAYYRLKNRNDRVSKEVLKNLDPEFVKNFFEREDTELQSPLKRMEKEQGSYGNKIANESMNNEETVIGSHQKFMPVDFEYIDPDALSPRKSSRKPL